MAAGPSAAYLGQGQVAPDSSGSPGTFAAFSTGMKVNVTPKKTQVDFSVLGSGPARRRAETLIDIDAKIEGNYDANDVGLTNLQTAAFAGAPLWLRTFDDATHYSQLSALCSDITWDTSDPSALTKVSASLAVDGTQASPWTRSTGGILIPATLPNPAAGYVAKCSINTPGTSTTLTDEAAGQVGATKTYQITAAAKRVLDPSVAVVVKDNAVAVTYASGNLIAVDMMFGTATFAGSYTVNGPVTISGAYLPMQTLVWIKKLTSNFKFELKDVTDLNSSGYHKRKMVATDYSAAFNVEDLAYNDPQYSGGNLGSSSWFTLVNSRTPVVIEHDPDGSQASVGRAWINLESDSEDETFADIVNQSIAGVLHSRSNGIYSAGFGLGKAN